MSASAERRALVLWHRVLPGPDGAMHEATSRWVRAVAARLHAAGGSLLGALGSHVAARFELADTDDALEEALALLDEARAFAPPVPAVFGAEVGPVPLDEPERTGAPPPHHGPALEVASLAASHAAPGEMLLGPSLASRLEGRASMAAPRSVAGIALRALAAAPSPAPPPASSHPPRLARPGRLAVLMSALRRGDGELVATEARRAMAEGCPPPAARRFLALARLLGGDARGALELLDSERADDGPARTRQAVARALVLLGSGAEREAVTEGLAALYDATRGEDEPGQRAALAVLALAFGRLGRRSEAEALGRLARRPMPRG